MKKATFLGLLMSIFLALTWPAKSEATLAFSDLYSVPWAEEAVYYLADQGIISGYGNGLFGPSDNITREQAATILVRQLYPNENSSTKLAFSDVETSNPHYNHIAVAVDNGLFEGYEDGTFKPKDKLTRAAAAKILVSAYDLEGQQTNFNDVDQARWAATYIQALASNGITSGYADGTFKPNNSVTRAEFSLFLARILNSSFKTKNEKVYPEYNLYLDESKFPIHLPNGLTLDIDYEHIPGPAIFREHEKIWVGGGPSEYGQIQFTITENNDLFLYHKWSAGGTEGVDLVGVRPNGEIFLTETIDGKGVGIETEFLTANKLEVGVERYNDDYEDMAGRFTGIYDFKTYSLSNDGYLTELPYIDEEFVTLAKRGKLKGVPGNLFMTYGALQSLNQGYHGASESFFFHNTIKATYALNYGGYENPFANSQPVVLLSRLVDIGLTEYEIRAELESFFGEPVEWDIYQAGNFYITFKENGYGKYDFYLGPHYEITIVQEYF